MSTLRVPRTSLASIICPSTHFLVPRLLRSPAPRALVLTQCLTRLPYTTHTKKGKKKSGRENHAGNLDSKDRRTKGKWENQYATHINRLHSACSIRDTNAIMDLYPTLLDLRLLTSRNAHSIASAIHTVIRNVRPWHPALKDLTPFVQRIVEDIKTGKLPPHHFAHVHLLGIFKSLQRYDEGYAFWQWLVEQKDGFVSPAVYGAAIELMAYGDLGHKLTDMESLYVDGLKRYPGTFAEYHLSPNAIVPNRDQPVAMIDLPISLLQGILTARVRCGELVNAYLALDTAFRLYPTQVPTRFFEIFMTERPLIEAYAVYLVACRAGEAFKPSHLTGLISRIRAAMTASSSLHDRMLLLRAVANSMYAHQEAGGELDHSHLGAFFGACEALLPELSPGEDYSGVVAEYRNAIVSMVHEFISQLLLAGMPAHARFFTALISLAGSLRVPSLLHATLRDLKAAQADLRQIGRRLVVRSAGLVGDKKLLEQYWSQIVGLAEKEGQHITTADWVTFVRACQHSKHTEYGREQILRLEHTLEKSITLRLTTILDHVEPKPEVPLTLTGMEQFMSGLVELKAQLKNIVTVVMSGQPMDLKITPFYMTLDPTQRPLGTPEDMRIVYDELSIDPHQPATKPDEKSMESQPSSRTGIPLGELRFQNWVSIVELLDQVNVQGPQADYRGADTLNVKINFEHRHQRRLPLPLDELRNYIKKLRTPSPIDTDDNARTVRASLSSSNIANAARPSLHTAPSSTENEAPIISRQRLSRQPLKKPTHPLGLQSEPNSEKDHDNVSANQTSESNEPPS